MIRPPSPWAIIWLAASWVPKKALFRLMSITLSNCSLGRVQDRGPGLDAGVVDEDVQAAEVGDRRLDQAAQVLDLAHVGLDADDLVTEGLHLGLDLDLGLLVRDVVDHDVGAEPGQGQDHRLADAGVAAGHDGHLSLQTHGPPVGAETVAGSGDAASALEAGRARDPTAGGGDDCGPARPVGGSLRIASIVGP